jgi:uncharacterized phage protein gp47/JayE
MADAPSAQDLFLVGRAEAIIAPTRFDKTIIDTEGSDVHVVFKVGAAMGEEVARYLQLALNELSLSTSRGEALDRWVFDRYQMTRFRAQQAVVTLELRRAGTVGFTVPAGSIFGTATGTLYRTTIDVPFPAGQPGPFRVPAVAETAGQAGNVPEGAISRVLTATGDATLTVTNPERAAGGTEDEKDDELRARARAFFVAAPRGTKAAIEYGALQAAGVVQASSVEGLDASTGLPIYRVQLFIADAAGQANTELAARVRRTLLEYRGWGVPVSVIPAVPQYVEVRATGLQFVANVNTAEVLDRAAASVEAHVNGLPPGTTLYRAGLLAALQKVEGLIVPDAALALPLGDLVPSTGTVIRTTRDRIRLEG